MPVYMIQAGEGGPVKIGHSNSEYRNGIFGRLQSLQSAHYETLSLLRVVPGERDMEDAYQFFFVDSHIRGEWFRFDRRMLTVDPEEVVAYLVANSMYLQGVWLKKWTYTKIDLGTIEPERVFEITGVK